MMRPKQELTQAIRTQFVNVRERGRILAQALKVRADIAATRRRLRLTFADLGETESSFLVPSLLTTSEMVNYARLMYRPGSGILPV